MIPRTTGFDNQKTIAFGFDGVIHSATSAWKDFDIIPDPPVDGALQALRSFHEAGYRIVVFTTRALTVQGFRAVIRWLAEHGFAEYVDQVSKSKPCADVYVDSKSLHFERFEGLEEQVEDFIRSNET